MKLSKVLYGLAFASLAVMLPLLLPTQAQKLSQNALEINKQDSSYNSQNQESPHLNINSLDHDKRDKSAHDSEKDDDDRYGKDNHENDHDKNERDEKNHDQKNHDRGELKS